MPVTKRWADQPFSLIHTPDAETDLATHDEYSLAASWMAVLHNGLIRGLNSIYLQAPHVKQHDYSDFIGYSLMWACVVDSHHQGEEECLFLDIANAVGEAWTDAMDENLRQHEAFHNGLTQFTTYLTPLQSNPSAFSPTTLLSIIDSFVPDLCKHLSDEISSLLSLRTVEPKIQLVQLWRSGRRRQPLPKWTRLHNELFFLFNHDATFEDRRWENFPPMPGYLRLGLAYGLSWWNWRWWKFASCDCRGMPKELYAMEEE